jgi:hypothetical protein
LSGFVSSCTLQPKLAPALARKNVSAEVVPQHAGDTACTCKCLPLPIQTLSRVNGAATPAAATEFLPDLLPDSAEVAAFGTTPALSFDELARSLFRSVPRVSEDSIPVELCLDRMRSKPGDAAPESIRSKTVRVYDVQRMAFKGRSDQPIAVLYSRYPPQDMATGALMSEWRLALIGQHSDVLADAAFVTRIPYLGSWDTTDTVLTLEGGRLVAHVVYGLACGANKSAQFFDVQFEIGLDPPCVRPGVVHHAGYL